MDAVTTAKKPAPDTPTPPGRPYDGTLRRERAAETRETDPRAGSELLHRSSVRDWKKLTVRAVAERAGVNERTVYRYFGSERGLRDAVMQRNEKEAGIDLAGMRLGDIATVAAQIFDHVAQYPREPRPPLDPTLVDAKDRQRQALLGAVATGPRQWTDEDRTWWQPCSTCSGAWPPTSAWSSTGRSITTGRSTGWPGSSGWSSQAVRDGRGPT